MKMIKYDGEINSLKIFYRNIEEKYQKIKKRTGYKKKQ